MHWNGKQFQEAGTYTKVVELCLNSICVTQWILVTAFIKAVL